MNSNFNFLKLLLADKKTLNFNIILILLKLVANHEF